jgi:hypothetical protein
VYAALSYWCMRPEATSLQARALLEAQERYSACRRALSALPAPAAAGGATAARGGGSSYEYDAALAAAASAVVEQVLTTHFTCFTGTKVQV